ncbi:MULTISPECIES: hypothetical protein [Kosakonia]|uniref:Uncharacterized protein n=1 Tax=Kosakonia quasisacchari TaxID=2529380 RepID=A0A4R0H5F1_9ENTR|nr:hypothetical protein [Kosakonia quasisacchari]TCC04554.1 hypothetical protein E0L21_15000 [Kosakonia quasisacchari]
MFLNSKYTNVHRSLLAVIKPALNEHVFENKRTDACFALKKLMALYNELRVELTAHSYPPELTDFLFTYECALITLDDYLNSNTPREMNNTIHTCFQFIETVPVLLRRVSVQYRMQAI